MRACVRACVRACMCVCVCVCVCVWWGGGGGVCTQLSRACWYRVCLLRARQVDVWYACSIVGHTPRSMFGSTTTVPHCTGTKVEGCTELPQRHAHSFCIRMCLKHTHSRMRTMRSQAPRPPTPQSRLALIRAVARARVRLLSFSRAR